MEKNKGLYLGTETDEKWWKRYVKNGLLEIIVETKIGKWHSGRWLCGSPILKIIWKKDDLRLNSGFFVSKDKTKTAELQEILANR